MSSSFKSHKAVFLDKDGTVSYPVFWNSKFRAPRSVREVYFYCGLKAQITKLKEIGFLVFIVTNQPDIEAGFINDTNYLEIEKYIKKELLIDEIKTCKHSGNTTCLCRKPKPEMILNLCEEYNIESINSWMVGDRISDIEAGSMANCKTILITHSKSSSSSELIIPSMIVQTPKEALDKIIEESTW